MSKNVEASVVILGHLAVLSNSICKNCGENKKLKKLTTQLNRKQQAK